MPSASCWAADIKRQVPVNWERRLVVAWPRSMSKRCSHDFAVAYAWAEVEMPQAQTVLMRLESDDAAKVWVNGEVVHENWVFRGVTPDDDLVRIHLRQGTNPVRPG